MRFSIVVPVYNTREYLPAAVDSVLGQTLPDLELILADDGSTDGSAGLCDRLAAEHPAVIRTLHLPCEGAGPARNAALETARGEYVLFLDSDDTLEPETCARLAEEIDRTGADVCFFGIRRVPASGSAAPAPAGTVGPVSLESEPSILFRWGDGAGGAAWRRTLFDRQDIRFGPWRAGEDLFMTRRMLAAAGSAVLLPDALYNYYIRQDSALRGSLDSSRDIMKAMEGILDWYEREGLFARYREELCALCVLHVFIYASWRVLLWPGSDPVLRQLREFTAGRFPDYRRNRYVRTWPLSRRVGMALLAGGMYPLLRLWARKK